MQGQAAAAAGVHGEAAAAVCSLLAPLLSCHHVICARGEAPCRAMIPCILEPWSQKVLPQHHGARGLSHALRGFWTSMGSSKVYTLIINEHMHISSFATQKGFLSEDV